MSDDKARELVERALKFAERSEKMVGTMNSEAIAWMNDARAYLHPQPEFPLPWAKRKPFKTADVWEIIDASGLALLSTTNEACADAAVSLSSRLAAAERVVEAAKVACEAFRVANKCTTDAKRWIALDGSSMLNLWKSVHNYDRERGAK